jgi:serine/threonine-protein kinase
MITTVVAAGDTLSDKYRIIRVIGEGGMAIVFEAEHLRLRNRVAIKMLRAEHARVPDVVERFEREGRALASLSSPNFVRVHDVDTSADGQPYLVMELLEGCDLEIELQRRGRLPVSTAVRYMVEVCNAMREAHARGIVHRDLKPTNLFLVRANDGPDAGVVKVLDFGIATDGPAANARLTRTDAVMGTPLYMAPEQLRSTRDVDARADIWALGATLYQLLTGSPPFTGTETTIGVAIVTDAPTPMEQLRPGVPLALQRIVERALEKDRERRFSSMDELARALLPFDLGDEALADTLAADEPSDEPRPGRPMLHTAPEESTAGRRAKKTLATALALALALVTAAALLSVQMYTRHSAAAVAVPLPVTAVTGATPLPSVPEVLASSPAEHAEQEVAPPPALVPVPVSSREPRTRSFSAGAASPSPPSAAAVDPHPLFVPVRHPVRQP